MTPFDTHAPLLPEIMSLHGKWKGRKPAIICDGEVMSWAEFDEQTNRLANALIERGVQRGDTIGIVMSNGTAMVISLIAVMKSGACSVPINLSVTDDAMFSMLNDADVRGVITTNDQSARVAAYVGDYDGVFHLKNEASIKAWCQSASPAVAEIPINGSDNLNIIYSSGTTGMPKGIVHTHAGRRDWAYDLSIALRYHGASRTLFTIGLYSNISWVGMLCTLLAGGTMVIHKQFDAAKALATIEDEAITNFAMVPIQLQRLLDAPNADTTNLTSVQSIMSCGSPLHPDLKESLFSRFGPRSIIELFGLTEGLITTLEPEEAEGRMASVGKPLIGTDIKIISDDGTPSQAGEAGEIVGIGRNLMPGYLNRPEATLEATWTDENGTSWFRTGDIGYLDEEGYLYVVDRKKDMILSGGQNIYPQDIEAALVQHLLVDEAAVIGIPSEKWGETPLAIVVPKEDADLAEEQLLNWVNARLGKQQRLSGLVFKTALPRNANGKILKRELREHYKNEV